MKKNSNIILLIMIIAIGLFGLLRANSITLALKIAGFHTYHVETIDHSFDTNKDEFMIIKTSSKKHDLILAQVTKNKLGFWKITNINYNQTSDVHLVSIGWFDGGGGIKKYDFASNYSEFEFGVHLAYCGNNALKLIEFYKGQIPENVTVNIQQARENFTIHVISFADSEINNAFNVRELLIKNKCIPKE